MRGSREDDKLFEGFFWLIIAVGVIYWIFTISSEAESEWSENYEKSFSKEMVESDYIHQ